jgi:hypothetical protein
VEVLAIRPDEQCRAVISLFEGTPWPHPAAVLVDWKRAAGEGERRSLGKPLEAMISAINPLMARELATLDGARLLLDFPDEGGIRWAMVVPEDDGSIAAFATALALTDGEPLPPEGAMFVDRLGPPGAPLIATGEPGSPAILASDRGAMASALRRGPVEPAVPGEEPRSGWIVRVDPEGMRGSGEVAVHRLGEALIGLGYQGIVARAALEGEAFAVVANSPRQGQGDRAEGWGRIDPRWLDPVPIDRASAVVSVAIGPGADAWSEAIGLADRIERADPDRADLAPLRQRLALFALARGARLEADLWPMLLGVTLWCSVDELGDLDAGLLALHASGEQDAARIADRVVARLLGDGIAVAGRPLEMASRGGSVLIGWGAGALESSLEAAEDPSKSAGELLREDFGASAPGRLGAVWPGRLPWIGEEGSPLRGAMTDGPPLIWSGWTGGGTIRDELHWGGLRALVRRFLERIPAEPTVAGESPIVSGAQP